MLPNFIVIGTAKSGTTSLYEYLRSHPDVYMAEPKELRFFSADDNWHRGIPWYEQHFAGVNGETAVGEASPVYTLYPAVKGVPERMAGVIPEARLVYMVRHPIERMVSHYVQFVGSGRERRPIVEALRENPRFFYGSCYTLQIERFLEHFPREQLLVLTSEVLRRNRGDTLGRIFEFLGVDPTWRHDTMELEFYSTRDRPIPRRFLGRIQSSKLYQRIRPFVPRAGSGLGNRIFRRLPRDADYQLPPETERRLRDAVADDVARLYQYVEGPFDGWGIA